MEPSASLATGSPRSHHFLPTTTPRASHQHKATDEQVCQVCSGEVGYTVDGKPFVACSECVLPLCRSCYEDECQQHGMQACPRQRQHKGSLLIKHDNDEGDSDVEYELSYQEETNKSSPGAEAMLDEKSTSRETATEHQPEFQAIIIPPMTLGSGSKRVYPLPSTEQPVMTPNVRVSSSSHSYGTVSWKDRLEAWKSQKQNYEMVQSATDEFGDMESTVSDLPLMDESRQPLSRKVSVSSSLINPYRMAIVFRLVAMAFYFRLRILNPVKNAYALWLTSIICEVWFALSWMLDQFPKWHPVHRETYLDRLSLRYEKKGEASRLAQIDVLVSTFDPMKEPPLVTANTVLSILAVDYPVEKLSCYVSDDGASILTFEALSETSEFARKWVPFCKKFDIEPRAPEIYFAQKIDYLKNRVEQSFVKERRAMKREYEEFKVRINALVANAAKVPDEGWTMQDGTSWPGNNTADHPAMIQVFLGHSGGYDSEGNALPRLVYVSREKRPGFKNHRKAGTMNALLRVSAVLTNAPFVLNLECDHYINNSCALREAMCFMMDSTVGKKICFVQFPQRFDGVDRHDRYANHNTVFFDISMKGLDGVQGPVYVGTGCVFRRQALYGYNAPAGEKTGKLSYNLFSALCCWRRVKRKASKRKREAFSADSSLPIITVQDIESLEGSVLTAYQFVLDMRSFERKYGQSPVLVHSTVKEDGGVPESATPSTLLREAIHVISCGYEDKTEWGKEIGWIYGSMREDILTGLKMHARGWRSVYCAPARAAFKGSAPINLADRLRQVLVWGIGCVEILLSGHCPIWYGYGARLKWLQRLAYINATVYPLTSIPLVAYCTLPAVCLFTGKFIIPEIGNMASPWFIGMFLSILMTSILEMRWSGVSVEEWWRNEQFWIIGGVSSHVVALFQGVGRVLGGMETNFTLPAKWRPQEGQLYAFKWTSLLIPPSTILVINMVGVAAGLSDAINNGYESWGLLFAKLFFSLWVILHLYPFLKGIMARHNRTPTIVIVWSILLASIFSLLWLRINPFVPRIVGPSYEECGVNC